MEQSSDRSTSNGVEAPKGSVTPSTCLDAPNFALAEWIHPCRHKFRNKIDTWISAVTLQGLVALTIMSMVIVVCGSLSFAGDLCGDIKAIASSPPKFSELRAEL